MTELDDRLLHLKDLSELMVDIAYSALIYNNKEIAQMVLDLEHRADEETQEIQIMALDALLEDKNVSKALTIIRLSASMEQIADSALDIVDVVLRDIEPHPILQMSVHESESIVLMERIAGGSILSGRPLGEITLASETGMWILAIKRDERWRYGVNENTVLKKGDIVIVRGPIESEEHFKELASGRDDDI